MTTTTQTTLLVSLALFVVFSSSSSSSSLLIGAQPTSKWLQSASDDGRPSKEQGAGGERVDRLTSATGDLSWPVTPGQLEWLLLQQVPASSNGQQLRVQPRYQRFADSTLADNLYANLDTNSGVGLDGPAAANLRAYHDDLVDEFKQYARGLVNPSRESRAFKPKLMSTARGFGKRAFLAPSRSITYSDLLEAANPNGAIQSHGKMSGAALR